MSERLGFDRLKGRENFSEWKIGAKAYLISKGHWKYVKEALTESAEERLKLADQKALAEIILLMDPSLYSYIENIDEAKKAWDKLTEIFEETSAYGAVCQFEKWILVKLSECASITEYVNKKMQLYAKCKSAGLEINDDLAGAFLLVGLGPDYKPLMMGIPKEKLSLDYVKNLLLQTATNFEDDGEQAMSVHKKNKKKQSKQRKNIKCYDCGGPHFRNKCNQNKKEKNEKGEFVLSAVISNENKISAFENENNDNSALEILDDDCNDNEECEFDTFSLCYENESSVYNMYSALATKDENDVDWFADSGASKHMTGKNLVLQNIRKPEINKVKVANNQKVEIKHVGDYKCSIGTNENVTLKDVHYVPDLCVNLLSVSQMVKNGHSVVFDTNGVKICSKDNTIIASGPMIDNMFKLKIKSHETAYSTNINEKDDSVLWHRRLAHINFNALKSLLNIRVKPDIQCVVCKQGKQARLPFSDSGTRANQLLEIIHSDVCGPMSVQTHSHSRYFVTFIDDYSRKCFAYPLKTKSQVFSKFIEFKTRVENETEKKIKTLRSDNGTEYDNINFHEYFAKHGIKHEKSAPYSPQQNGLAERMNRTIFEKARCMLLEACLPKQFWAEAVLAAVGIINAIPHTNGIAPNEVFYKRKCNLNIFRVFGCRAMVWKPDQKRKKLDAKSFECIYLRYADDAKAYRLYDATTKKIVISRDVVFMENESAIVDSTFLKNERRFIERATINDESDDLEIGSMNESFDSGESGEENESKSPAAENVENEPESPAAENVADEQLSPVAAENENMPVITIDDSVDENTAEVGENSVYEDTFMDDGEKDSSLSDPTFVTRAGPGDRTERVKTRNGARQQDLLNFHMAFMVDEPQTYKEALKDENCERWKMAMKEEYDSLLKNETWELVERPLGEKIVDNKWVYKVKSEQENKRFKARLVARGFTQQYGVNYFETFSPVVRFTSIRLILALAAQMKMHIKQFDVKTSFFEWYFLF